MGRKMEMLYMLPDSSHAEEVALLHWDLPDTLSRAGPPPTVSHVLTHKNVISR
jgi:hypothetical protein